MKRILFVDDEPNVLEGLQRMLFPMRKEWDMVFANSGQEALGQMERGTFDVIVSDMRMPQMDGATLLTEVMNRHPQTVRFVLTGQSDEGTVYRCVGPVHQFLTKPCDSKILKASVDRALALRDLLNNEALRQFVSSIETLPTLPETYTRLMKEIQSQDSSVATIGKIIESDVAMTAKLLKLVNSAFFGLRTHVSSASHAVSLLGLDTIRALVLVAHIFTPSKKSRLATTFPLDALWEHSMTVGTFAEAICRRAGANEATAKDAFTAGVLHDSGILVLGESRPKEYKAILDRSVAEHVPLDEVEQAGMGCTHGDIGAYLLGIWGLPDEIVEAVAYHHAPSRCVSSIFCPLTAVHVANAITNQTVDARWGGGEYPFDFDYLDRLGLRDQLPIWQAACAALQDRGDSKDE